LDSFAERLPPNAAGFLHCLPLQEADAESTCHLSPVTCHFEKKDSWLYRFMVRLGFYKKREARRKWERQRAESLRKMFAKEAPKTRDWEFSLFPSAPTTDWARAFSAFIDYLKQCRANSSLAAAPQVVESRLTDGCRLTIDKNGRIFVFDKQGLEIAEVPMPTLSKVLYFCFLRHPEGIALKCLVDYRDELLQYYQTLSPAKWDEKNIERLIDPTDNSANEKLSRIRKAFKEALPAFSDSRTAHPPRFARRVDSSGLAARPRAPRLLGKWCRFAIIRSHFGDKSTQKQAIIAFFLNFIWQIMAKSLLLPPKITDTMKKIAKQFWLLALPALEHTDE